MKKLIMRLKSGREFRFKCEEYTIETFKPTGTLSDFSYKGGVGECPIYFQIPDVECIAVIKNEQIEALEQEQPEIIRCKNCRHDNNCEIQYSAQAGSEFFCGLAERESEK